MNSLGLPEDVQILRPANRETLFILNRLVHQLEPRKPLQQCLKDNFHVQPRQVVSKAQVSAQTESQMTVGRAIYLENIGVFKLSRITICRTVKQTKCRARRKNTATN